MNKIVATTILIATIFLNTACTKNEIDLLKSSYTSESKDNNAINIGKNANNKIIDLPIEITSNDKKEIIHAQIEEDSTLQSKVELIVQTISQEAFNGLPINVTIYGNDMARIILNEYSDNKNNRLSWKRDYLNENNKENTINTIVKNLLQEQYKGTWIKTVQLYYEDELITLD